MTQLPVASMTVEFGRMVSTNVLIEALDHLVTDESSSSFYANCGYFPWSSVRSSNGILSYRIGLREVPNGDALKGGISTDILFVPCDGRSDEWFVSDRLYEGIVVRTRICSDDLGQPLRHRAPDEMRLCSYVSVIAQGISQAVRSINLVTS